MIDAALVSFVGAGPGDPELVTVKGLARLRAADVVIHDRLVAPELLREARPTAPLVDVGKAPGRHCMGQGQINALLVDRARRYRRVVRLRAAIRPSSVGSQRRSARFAPPACDSRPFRASRPAAPRRRARASR